MVKKGDRIVLYDGTRVVVVNRFHKRQTRGYWVNGCRSLEDAAPDRFEDMWPVNDQFYYYRRDYKFGPEQLTLCAESELDSTESESNEYGEVSP